MSFLQKLFNIPVNKEINNINKPTETIKSDKFNYNTYIKNETQLFRIRTNASNLRTALLMAENPYQRNRFELLRVYQNIALDASLNGLLKQ